MICPDERIWKYWRGACGQVVDVLFRGELLMTSALEDLYLSMRSCPVLLSLSVPFERSDEEDGRFSRDIDEDVSTRILTIGNRIPQAAEGCLLSLSTMRGSESRTLLSRVQVSM